MSEIGDDIFDIGERIDFVSEPPSLEEEIFKAEVSQTVNDALLRVSAIQELVVRARLGLGQRKTTLSLEELAANHGLSVEKFSRLELILRREQKSRMLNKKEEDMLRWFDDMHRKRDLNSMSLYDELVRNNEGLSFSDIARAMGRSSSRPPQIFRKAIERLSNDYQVRVLGELHRDI